MGWCGRSLGFERESEMARFGRHVRRGAWVSVLVSGFLGGGVVAGEHRYASVSEAIAALAGRADDSRWAAVEYLAKHPEESVPRLLMMVEKQEKGWIFASEALVQSRDKAVVPAYIELLRANFYEKEADGSKKQYGYGTKNGCSIGPFLYGGVLAEHLGRMGDPRAMPVLRAAATQGDYEVRQRAYEALYRLGGLSLDELFGMAKKNADPDARIPDIIERVGWRSIGQDTRFAIKVFDRVIAELSNEEYLVASAHYWKVHCFEALKQYDEAVRECGEVMKFSRFENLTSQMRTMAPRLRALASGKGGEPKK